jgi:hypothetical protein
VVRIGKWGTYFGQSGVRISTISKLVRIYVHIGMYTTVRIGMYFDVDTYWYVLSHINEVRIGM